MLAEWSWTAGANHSRHLGRIVAELLTLQKVDVSALTGVVVATGPGSFSGVRVAISTGKGLAMARDIPLVGISTLDAIGFQASPASNEVWGALPAGRDQVYLAHYICRGAEWGRDGDYRLERLPAAAELVAGADMVAGEAARSVQAALRERGTAIRIPEHFENVRRPAYLAELGARYLKSGGADQLDTVEPLYLRRSAAEEQRAAHSQE